MTERKTKGKTMNEEMKIKFAEIVNAEIAKENNGDRVANLEIIREYFTNDSFREYMEDASFAATK
jgi:hypothetical protein